MKTLSLIASAALLVLSGCASMPITPAGLKAMTRRTEESNTSLSRWQEAVSLGNAFLASPHRKTLPEGKLRLTDEGMEFVTSSNTLLVRVRCTSWGDLLVPTGMAAQERSDGFVVGSVTPNRSRLLDNTFFKYANGEPAPAAVMAALTLHELTHSYYRCGTVSFIQGFLYYAESLFLFRYRHHSMERLPYRTSDEFWSFYVSRLREHPTPGNP